MAGSPSASGPLNSEIPETSSHLEIGHESKDSEISRDSSEVYGLERKPMPPASKFTHGGFREAAVDSAWYAALEIVDCGALMSLLQGDPSLLAQTSFGGCTVLHAAAKGGCLQLLDEVFDLFKNIKDGDRQFLDEVSGVEISLDALVDATYGDLKVRACDLARFTCPDRVCRALEPWGKLEGRFSPTPRSGSDPSQHLRDKLVEIMETEPARKAFKRMEKGFRNYSKRNAIHERKELSFHYACESEYCDQPIEPEDPRYPRVVYAKTIIDACDMLAPPDSVDVLTYLFQLHNARGQTPFHLAVRKMDLEVLLELVPKKDDYKDCLNAKDVRGWTVLHYVVARGTHYDESILEILLEDERVDVNATTPLKYDHLSLELAGMTALHLAILHKNIKCLKVLLKCPRTNVNALFYRRIVCGYERWEYDDTEETLDRRSFWSPLQLAAITGSSDAVRALLQFRLDDIYDVGKFENKKCRVEIPENFRKVSALLLAAGSGNPDTLRVFLDHPKFNPLVEFEGATALHYAANAMTPTAYLRPIEFTIKIRPFLAMTDLRDVDVNYYCRYEEEDWHVTMPPTAYLGRQACVSMLLQAGVNIWDKDQQLRFAEPGPQAPSEAHLWWQERIEYETSEARKSLRDGGYAISVVAALVASASYGGPLQPPLGFGTDPPGVQDTHSTIRVFMVSNSLSFLFAIASVLFAVVPSLPMPQEAIYVEWQRTRRTVGLAIFFILMSVICVLISFGAAWSSVVSEHYSFDHVGLLFYPILVGGLICLLALGLFFLRLLRLVFSRNARIRYLYRTYVKF